MNTIIKIETKIPLTLVCTFDNGIVKHINLQSITHLPVFSFLKNENEFKELTNHGYFIEWKRHEADLSADTLLNWNGY